LGIFLDRLLVQLSDPATLTALLAPASDANHDRLRSLINAAYELPFATLHDVLNVQVVSSEFERPLFPPERTSGTWTQTTPSYKRTDVSYQSQDGLSPAWIDVVANISLDLVLEVDPGQIATVLTRNIEDITSLDDFRSRFQFFDLDAFLAKHHLTTVEELRDAFDYLLAEIRLQALTPFNPADPANRRRYTLQIAIFIRESLDLSSALRDAKLARTAAERALTYHQIVDVAEVRTPLAPLLIFPGPLAAGGPFSEAQLQTFFGLENILALFVTLS
jgi:hypothetical protein